jgi:hypothetical protein
MFCATPSPQMRLLALPKLSRWLLFGTLRRIFARV